MFLAYMSLAHMTPSVKRCLWSGPSQLDRELGKSAVGLVDTSVEDFRT